MTNLVPNGFWGKLRRFWQKETDNLAENADLFAYIKKSKQIFVVLSTNYPKGALRNYSRTLVQITSLFYKNLK